MKNSTWDFIKTLTMVYVILTSFFSTSSSVYANAATQSEIFFNLKPIRESRNNCFVLLEPIREDEVESRIIEVVCGLTNVELETKYRTSSSYVVRSQQMVSTPIAELNREIVKEDGWNEFDFIIQTRD